MKSGAVSVSQPDGHVSYFQMRTDEHGQPDDEVDERARSTPPSGSSVRGK